MDKPVLVVMAAGMGSRYGGLKQIDPVSEQGEILLDFSMYDAMMAGFEKVIFIIRKEHEKDFRALIDNRGGKYMEVEYAFQELSDLPEGYIVPEGRTKPWGTCHAVLSARKLINGPFAVINADDYYGAGAFSKMYDFLEKAQDSDKYDFSMVGYKLVKTLTENGYVSRGICQVNEAGELTSVKEHLKIQWEGDRVVYTEEDGETCYELNKDSIVSMNFWGFTKSILEEMESGFPKFLDRAMAENPMKAEYFLPSTVQSLIDLGKAKVKVLKSSDQWYGVTYKEDKESVVAALQSMKDKGLYPEKLWK